MRLPLFLLLALALGLVLSPCAVASPGDFGMDGAQDPDEGLGQGADMGQGAQQTMEKARVDDETVQLVLSELDGDCRDNSERVLMGQMDQKELDEDCSKRLMEVYNRTPMGQLMQRENQVVAMAGLVRLTPSCQKQFKKPKEGVEPRDPSDACREALRKQQQAMSQWLMAVTYPKYSDACKLMIKGLQENRGHLTVECVAEMKTIKPAALETLELQTESMTKKHEEERAAARETKKTKRAEDAVKEEEHQKHVLTKKEKRAADRRFATVFVAVWACIIAGALMWGYKYYQENPDKRKSFVKPPTAEEQAAIAALEQAEAAPKSKRQLKLDARKEKQQNAGRNARR
jgi:hypothetical protein